MYRWGNRRRSNGRGGEVQYSVQCEYHSSIEERGLKGGGAIKVASEEPASSSVHYLGNHQHRPPWAAQVTKQGITPQKPLKTLTTPQKSSKQHSKVKRYCFPSPHWTLLWKFTKKARWCHRCMWWTSLSCLLPSLSRVLTIVSGVLAKIPTI